jgi:hypothetical protein
MLSAATLLGQTRFTVIAPPEPVAVVFPQSLVAVTFIVLAAYVPTVAPVIVIVRVVDEPVSPVGNVHE